MTEPKKEPTKIQAKLIDLKIAHHFLFFKKIRLESYFGINHFCNQKKTNKNLERITIHLNEKISIKIFSLEINIRHFSNNSATNIIK
ncbi:hypothetical protein BpHYR1_041383 [Brachionus plicatilis]|uniref:Uncharacterized protein n=1 Tax=Brachionus plicatilis TaxID=10195 RepID=A0A3M7SLE2_BRAPC|nr:hypothetical protein BpHYR1_041383 [Brachionus plicatilis]